MLHDPETGKSVRYETYHPERETPYCGSFKGSSEWRCDPPPHTVTEDAEDEAVDDDYDEFCEELSSGVTDIIITGEVSRSLVKPDSETHDFFADARAGGPSLGGLLVYWPSKTLGWLCCSAANVGMCHNT
jgi:hypothetical protein